MPINFIYSKNCRETCTTHTESENIEIMIGSETDDIIDELFKSLFQRYQEGLEESLRENEFIFDSVDLLYYNLQKISLKRGGLYVDSPKQLKNKKAIINPKNKKDDKYFQYAIIPALHHKKIKTHQKRTSNLKPFISQYDWKEIDFTSHSKDWKKFQQNNKTIALNILFVPYNTKQIRLAYKSKGNFKRKNQVNLLMITDGKKWQIGKNNKLP